MHFLFRDLFSALLNYSKQKVSNNTLTSVWFGNYYFLRYNDISYQKSYPEDNNFNLSKCPI